MLLWPRREALTEDARGALDGFLDGKPLHRLAGALRELRRGQAGSTFAEGLEVTLLWDPPPDEEADTGRRARLHGVSQ